MGKIRVHELAKELGRTSGEVITALTGMGIADVKAASGIDEDLAMKVRERFSAPRASAPSPAAGSAPVPGGGTSQAARKEDRKQPSPKSATGEEGAPKKKKFVAVFRRENARSGVISRMPTKQAQQRSAAPVAHTARPVVRRRPADPALRPADPSLRMARPEENNPAAVSARHTVPADSAQPVRRPQPAAGVPAAGSISQENAARTATAASAPAQGAAASSAPKAEPQGTRPAAPAARREAPSQVMAKGQGALAGGKRNAAQGGQGVKRPAQGDRHPARQDQKSADGRRPYQQERTRSSQQGARGQQSGQFSGRGQASAPAAPSKPGALSGRGGQGRNGSSKNRFDAGRDSTQNRGKNPNARREGKDRNEKYNRFDANDRVQTGRRRKDQNKAVQAKTEQPKPIEEKIKTIILPDHITLKELADKMKVPASPIIKKLFMDGKMVTMNTDLTFEEAEEIAVEYEILCEHEEKKDLIADLLREEEENEENLVSRPPVVCVMGHVDHGKTSLLDAIRDTHVTDRESGGITQHIGASVIHYNDRTITFLDTPGHEAFTAMRMRGANSTDIAVLVVAADDGVMPQTVEAINHARAAGIEIIVAINKIDKPSANIDRVKQELTEYELISEDWGGSTTMVPVSAKSHQGIDDLLEMILLTADVMELKSNPNRRARGLVIEAKLDKGRGPVASLLIQKGTLHVGDPIDAGACFGKVRAMTDDKGRRVKEAGPSMPVEVIGFSDVPGAGEVFTSPETEKEAKSFAATFITVGKEKMIEESRKRTSLDDLFNQIKEGTLKDLNLIVKADVQGSVEALRQSLLKLTNEEVIVKIIHSAVGAINESDVTLAGASNAIIIGFNVRPDAQAKSTAEHEGVDIRLYKVIYDAINDVENAMKGMLAPVYEEKITGHVEIRQIFKASGVGNIAGSYVLDGTVARGSKARITRDGKQIFDGAIASLKRFKDDVKEVRAGFECGLVFDGFSEIREGDQCEVYTMIEVARS